jgi:hypothetical protein
VLRYILVVAIIIIVSFSAYAEGEGGSVCLGPNLSVVLHDRDHVTISIGEVKGITFSKDNSPKVVAEGLDRDKIYPVTIYYDGEPVETMTLDFGKLKSRMALLWRAKGGYRIKPAPRNKCTWPAK